MEYYSVTIKKKIPPSVATRMNPEGTMLSKICHRMTNAM